MASRPLPWITRYSLTAFFVLAFGWTWGLSLFTAGGPWPAAVPPPLQALSSLLLHYGPAFAALALAWAAGGRAGQASGVQLE